MHSLCTDVMLLPGQSVHFVITICAHSDKMHSESTCMSLFNFIIAVVAVAYISGVLTVYKQRMPVDGVQ